MLRLPLAAKAPLQLPDAVHDVAWVEDQVSVVDPPASIMVLDASSDAVGSAGGDGDGGGGEDPPPQPVIADTPSMIKTMKRMEIRHEGRSVDPNVMRCARKPGLPVNLGYDGHFTGPIRLC